MNELLDKRYKNLESSVSFAFKRMEKIGILQQLGKYRATSAINIQRFTDVFEDSLDAQREKYIQKILNDIDHCSYEINRLESKIIENNMNTLDETAGVREENKKLKDMHQAMRDKVQKCEDKQNLVESRLLDDISSTEFAIKFSTDTYIRSKQLLNLTKISLIDLSTAISLNYIKNKDSFKPYIDSICAISPRVIKKEIHTRKSRLQKQIQRKENEIDKISIESAAMLKSVEEILNYCKKRNLAFKKEKNKE